MLLPAIVAILPALTHADPRLKDRPPILHFEANYHGAFAASDDQRRRRNLVEIGDIDTCSAEINPPVSPIDLRVTKAHAQHGYDMVRISVITYSKDPPTFTRGPIDVEGGASTSEDLTFDYSGKFQYRWTSQFDTGLHGVHCHADPDEETGISPLLNITSYKWDGFGESPSPDSECLFACQDNDECKYYSFYYNATTKGCQCELFSSCNSCNLTAAIKDPSTIDVSLISEQIQEYADNLDGPHTASTDILEGWTTTKKYGNSHMHTKLVKVVPGVKNPFKIDTHEFDVNIPKEGERAKCIVWGDPCISSKFVGCSFGKYFDAYEKSVDMLNALAEAEDGFDCFIMLGDNFYDSDGRISVSFWKRLSTKAMSKVLIYILGNHDIWTGGAPDAGVVYDPLQYSLQYLGLDTVAGLDTASTGNWFNYQINPDNPPAGLGTKYQSIQATSSIGNSISWFKLGGFGMLFFNGAYDSSELSPYFEEACSFFGDNIDDDGTIILIGHWNGHATIQSWISPYGGQMMTPDARNLLSTMPGCSKFGKNIIYFDGHGHMNEIVTVDNGYLMGAHGIMGMYPHNFSDYIGAEYGFFYTHSSPTEVHYCQEIFAPSPDKPTWVGEFDNSTINSDKYYEIIECLEEGFGGIQDCLSICEEWPYFGREEESTLDSPSSTPVSNTDETSKPTAGAKQKKTKQKQKQKEIKNKNKNKTKQTQKQIKVTKNK